MPIQEIIDAWAQPALGRARQELPEVVRLFEKSGTPELLDCKLTPAANPVSAVRELDRAVRQLGLKALRVGPWLWKLPPSDKLYYPLYVRCVELGIPFCTQMGHTGPWMPSETGRPIPYLDEVVPTFPELRLEARQRLHRHVGLRVPLLSLVWNRFRLSHYRPISNANSSPPTRGQFSISRVKILA